MSKALVDRLIKEFLTNPAYKRRWDTVLRSQMGGKYPHITTITKEDLVTLYRHNTIAALYNEKKFTEAEEAASRIKGIEEAAEAAAKYVFDTGFEQAYLKTTGKRKGSVFKEGGKIIVRQPAGLHSAVKRIIWQQGWKHMSESPALSKNSRDRLKSKESRVAFRRRTQDLHEDRTTVGAFTLAKLYEGLLDKTVDSGFTVQQTTAIAKSIGEYFGDVTGTWKKNTTVKEYEINDTLEIPLTIGPSSLNPPGSESYDWKQLRRKLEDSLVKEISRGTFGQEYMQTGGSKPLSQKALERGTNIVIDELLKPLKGNKNVSIKITRPKEEGNVRYSGNAKIAGKQKRPKNKRIARKGYPAPTKAQRESISPVSLMSIINSRLPQTVVKNMGAPRLENRTGRFANSVRVTDIQATRQGYPSIGYTYQREPYGVFESTSGTRFSDVERDPRQLIEGSIREIAAELAIGRFYTRRV